MRAAEGREGRDWGVGSGLLHLLGTPLFSHRATGALTLLQPASRLHHQPALGLGQLLTEVVTFGLHFLQPLLPALCKPQFGADAHWALLARDKKNGLYSTDR